eukprot:GILI01051653.1.p1 GENE.GILI01051653.1~~GILI01051653.1.p1  ORF type:complete len:148 (-),score=2.98 GILI01051653.1:251-643(-)
MEMDRVRMEARIADEVAFPLSSSRPSELTLVVSHLNSTQHSRTLLIQEHYTDYSFLALLTAVTLVFGLISEYPSYMTNCESRAVPCWERSAEHFTVAFGQSLRKLGGHITRHTNFKSLSRSPCRFLLFAQ